MQPVLTTHLRQFLKQVIKHQPASVQETRVRKELEKYSRMEHAVQMQVKCNRVLLNSRGFYCILFILYNVLHMGLMFKVVLSGLAYHAM